METYYCIKCFNRYDRPYAGPVHCPKCGHNFMYWSTSPYKASYTMKYLPIEIKQQIMTSLDWDKEDDKDV